MLTSFFFVLFFCFSKRPSRVVTSQPSQKAEEQNWSSMQSKGLSGQMCSMGLVPQLTNLLGEVLLENFLFNMLQKTDSKSWVQKNHFAFRVYCMDLSNNFGCTRVHLVFIINLHTFHTFLFLPSITCTFSWLFFPSVANLIFGANPMHESKKYLIISICHYKFAKE